jgi:hypothetical protein
MFTKEEIIKEIKRIAGKLDVKTLKQQEFIKNSTIPINTVQYTMGTWKQALEEAGLDKSDSSEMTANKELASDDELLSELVRLYNISGIPPTAELVNARGKWGEIYYRAKWKTLDEAFKKAKEKYPEEIKVETDLSEEVMPGEFILNSEMEQPEVEEVQKVPEIQASAPAPQPAPAAAQAESPRIKFIPKTIKPQKAPQKTRIMGEKILFRGLKYAPMNREGVIYLFGMIAIEMGFLVKGIANEYPQADARRCIDIQNQRWEGIRIEFEYKSSDFKDQDHNEDDCDMIICWHHDWDGCPLEILELKTIIKNLDNFNNV